MTKTIIFIGPGLLPIPSDRGAIEEIIWKTSLELLKRGFRVRIFNPMSKDLFTRSAKTIRLHGLSWGMNEKSILHFHDIISCVAYSTTTPKFQVKNTILTLHYPPWITRNKRRYVTALSILKYLAARGIVFSAPSTAIVCWLKETFNSKAVLVPNGVDTKLFHPSRKNHEIREKLLDGKEVLITYVARICPDKNQLDLLRATNLLIYNYGIRNFKVVFIGPLSGTFSHNHKNGVNPYYLLLKNYAERNNLGSHVVFLGMVPNKREVAVILASSDIYVHTSKVEAATPLAIMEAMASGLPVVTYKLVYYDFLIHGLNALVVGKGNINELALRLAIVIEDKNLRRYLGESARKFAEEYLSWDKIVESYYVKLYESLGMER